jgi:hypothetical protein
MLFNHISTGIPNLFSQFLPQGSLDHRGDCRQFDGFSRAAYTFTLIKEKQPYGRLWI